LPFDGRERPFRHFVAEVSANRDPAWPDWMLELPVAAFRRYHSPTLGIDDVFRRIINEHPDLHP
jgi:hypothetical protein